MQRENAAAAVDSVDDPETPHAVAEEPFELPLERLSPRRILAEHVERAADGALQIWREPPDRGCDVTRDLGSIGLLQRLPFLRGRGSSNT
jgi:hypothetical protein